MQQPFYPGAPGSPAAPFVPVLPEVLPDEDAPPGDGELFDALAKDILPDRFVVGGQASAAERADESLSPLARMADEESSTDVLGSYTGMASDGEPPVQDADDL